MNEHIDDGTKSLARQRRKTRRLVVFLLIALAVVAVLGWKLASSQKENARLREENTLLCEQLTARLTKLPFGL